MPGKFFAADNGGALNKIRPLSALRLYQQPIPKLIQTLELCRQIIAAQEFLASFPIKCHCGIEIIFKILPHLEKIKIYP
jgi:hypothetical protein